MNIILASKKIISSLLFYSKILKAINYFSSDKCFILAYHRVLSDNDESINYIQPGMYVTASTFEKHIAYISSNYDIISLNDLDKIKKIKDKYIITFDDGWYDNYKYAFPILKKYNIPATIFLSTGFIGTNKWPWPDRLSFYLYSACEEKTKIILNIIKKYVNCIDNKVFKSKNKDQKIIILCDALIKLIKNIEHQKIYALFEEIDEVMRDKHIHLEQNRPWLIWEEIIEMSQHNISFGAHTHNHVILTQTSIENAYNEILISRDIISEKLNSSTALFCYPNGNYNEKIVNILKNSEFKIAVTTKNGSISPDDNRLLLNRISIHEDISKNLSLFACKIKDTIPLI